MIVACAAAVFAVTTAGTVGAWQMEKWRERRWLRAFFRDCAFNATTPRAVWPPPLATTVQTSPSSFVI